MARVGDVTPAAGGPRLAAAIDVEVHTDPRVLGAGAAGAAACRPAGAGLSGTVAPSPSPEVTVPNVERMPRECHCHRSLCLCPLLDTADAPVTPVVEAPEADAHPLIRDAA